MLTRHFNQDPVENFFSSIRSHGLHNTNPSCCMFISAYKSLVVNNLVSSHSVASNCEEDESDGCLSMLRSFLTGQETSDLVSTKEEKRMKAQPLQFVEQNYVQEQSLTYVSGFLLKKIFPIIRDCCCCRNYLVAKSAEPVHGIISAREYNAERRLHYPSDNFIQSINIIKEIIFFNLPIICHKTSIKKQLLDYIKSTNALHVLICDSHRNLVEQSLYNLCFKIFVHTWCKNVTKILHGRKHITCETSDTIKIAAAERYRKYFKYKIKK